MSCIDLISVQEMFLKFEFSFMSSFEELKEAIDPRKSFLTNVLVGGNENTVREYLIFITGAFYDLK